MQKIVKSPQKTLFYVGYKGKSLKNKDRCYDIHCLYLTEQHQKQFAEWYDKIIEPQVDKKIKELINADI